MEKNSPGAGTAINRIALTIRGAIRRMLRVFRRKQPAAESLAPLLQVHETADKPVFLPRRLIHVQNAPAWQKAARDEQIYGRY